MKKTPFLEVITRNWAAKILSLAAAILLFLFYTINSMRERYFNVPLRLIIDQDFAASNELPGSVRITIRGSEADIFSIDETGFTVFADFSSHAKEGYFRMPVHYSLNDKTLTKEEAEKVEISISPETIALNLEEKLSKVVNVLPRISGSPGKGFELADFSLTPDNLQVSGPRSQIEKLTSIYSLTIDIEGATENFSRKAALDIDNNYLKVVNDQEITFFAIIQEKMITVEMENIAPILIDLSPEYAIDYPQAFTSLQIQGTEQVMEGLRQEDVQLIIDCSTIDSPGLYTLKVAPLTPVGINVLRWTPEEIPVTARKGASR